MKGLECSKRAESIINRKVSFFTSKLHSTFFSTPKNYFSEIGRKKSKKQSETFWKIFEKLKKVKMFQGKSYDFRKSALNSEHKEHVLLRRQQNGNAQERGANGVV